MYERRELIMILIYYVGKDGLIPVTTAATKRIAEKYISDNQNSYEDHLQYMKLGYEWR